MTLERRDLWRGYTSPKHLSNTLLPFHDVVQINSHQKRMLAVTMPAINNDIIYRHSILLEMISVAAHYSSITAVVACLDLQPLELGFFIEQKVFSPIGTLPSLRLGWMERHGRIHTVLSWMDSRRNALYCVKA